MVTTLYAGILGLMYLGLTFFTIAGRFKYGVNLGMATIMRIWKKEFVYTAILPNMCPLPSC